MEIQVGDRFTDEGFEWAGFAGYLAYRLPVLIPLFALVGALFLAR